jgi:hypothetical protein
MPGGSAGLVDIIREFLAAHRLMDRLAARYRDGSLRFDELDALIGDHEESVLFRLKERCHALFRADEHDPRVVRHQEVLFDLAVGSLFHEAMKLREDFYQREVYGPRMRALRSQAGDEAEALFGEFERILSVVNERIEEVLQEVEALFLRTREQLRLLLAARSDEAHAVRFLIEHRATAEEVFSEELDRLLAGIYGDPATAYAFAGRSYLVSGYFGDAERSFAEAIARGGERGELERLCSYARGMRAYMTGDYDESVRRLGQWIEADAASDAVLADFAHAAVSRIHKLAVGGVREHVARDAGALAQRLTAARGAASQAGRGGGRDAR